MGECTSARSDSYAGACIHPNGTAKAKMNNWTGKKRAATTPPALNNVQKIGSVSRLTICLLSARDDDDGNKHGDYDPCEVLRPGNQRSRQTLSANPNYHGLGRQIEPRNRVQQQKCEGDYVESDHPWRTHSVLKTEISLRTTNQRANLKQDDRYSPGDSDATQFPQNELHICPLAQPPIG